MSNIIHGARHKGICFLWMLFVLVLFTDIPGWSNTHHDVKRSTVDLDLERSCDLAAWPETWPWPCQGFEKTTELSCKCVYTTKVRKMFLFYFCTSTNWQYLELISGIYHTGTDSLELNRSTLIAFLDHCLIMRFRYYTIVLLFIP